MLLTLDSSLAAGYKSKSQISGKISESWVANNLYCSACSSNKLNKTPNNTVAVDFVCPQCGQNYQLKSRLNWSERKVADADYKKMMDAVSGNASPNLLVLHYSQEWQVKKLLLVPSFFFTPSTIEKRNPLGPHTQRAGWVGCNILLSAIASEGKLWIVSNGSLTDVARVRHQYQMVKPLSQLDLGIRGWTLDVLKVVSQFGARPFQLQEVYRFEAHLAALHPGNHNVQAKIRQRIQKLRDLGLVRFLGHGRYVLVQTDTH